MEIFQISDWESMDKRIRTTFFNTVSGFKNAVLVGTADPLRKTNLAIFNSVVHLGADPALLGFILRPHSVPRHTYENLRLTGHYTFNLVTSDMAARAHQTSAKYPKSASEFEACNFEEHWQVPFPAPFVSESPIRIGLEYEEEHDIKANGTKLVVGRVVELHLAAQSIGQDGFVDLECLGTLCTNGLDAYYMPKLIDRFPYARP